MKLSPDVMIVWKTSICAAWPEATASAAVPAVVKQAVVIAIAVLPSLELQQYAAGVVRAVDIVERALELYGRPVYVRHEIVHNKHVVDSLKNKGAVFVEDVKAVPTGAVTIFSEKPFW